MGETSEKGSGPVQTTFPFTFRGQKAAVTVDFAASDDPERWGLGVLDIPWPLELEHGLPVIEARVSTSVEGYAAVMGWIQVVRMHVDETSTALVPGSEKAPPGDHTLVDGPPQLQGTGVPFVCYGHCPTLFDAPLSTESDIRFVADSFLTASPDSVLSRRSSPCFGMRWGYATHAGETPELLPPTLLDETAWREALPTLQETFPAWTFEETWAEQIG